MISVTINTTTKQDNRLAEFLASVNAGRVAQGDQPFADINALATDLLKSQLLSWVKSMDSLESDKVKSAYDSASNTAQNQVRALLGLT